MKKISSYFRGVAIEARRVRWPNRQKLWSSVGKVVVITVICAVVLLLCDLLAANIVSAFEQANSHSSSEGSSSADRSIVEAVRIIRIYLGGRI